jgi:hypothetical protein
MEQSVPKRRHKKIQTPGNYPDENMQHTEHGESLKSRRLPNWRVLQIQREIAPDKKIHAPSSPI